MSSTLHITNGDILSTRLRDFNFSGKIVSWNAMLCEGKTTPQVGSESFWKERFLYLNQVYKVSKSQFIDKTLKEYRNLCNHKQPDEIVLWFDGDLYCQINLLGVLNWIRTHRPDHIVSLVLSKKKISDKLPPPLSSLTEEQLSKRYNDRITLSKDTIETADYLWHLYSENNPGRLLKAATSQPLQLPHMARAIELHIQRFPEVHSGLNLLETRFLELARKDKPKNKKEWVSQMLLSDTDFGYADIQYHQMAEQLSSLIRSVSTITLLEKAKKALDGSLNVYPLLRNDVDYLGGSLKYSFLYYRETGELLKL